MFKVTQETQMTPELLGKFISQHKSISNKRYKRLQEAYENKYRIYKDKAKPRWKPDNRVSVNFAKYIVDTMNGFFTGIPIKTTSEDDAVSDYLLLLDQYNDQENNNAEIAKICDIYGSGHEMYYVDEAGQVGITYLTPMEAFMIYDDSILERPVFFVRYYTDADGVERGSWSDENHVQYFVRSGGYKWTDEHIHGFDGVPATEFMENDERIGIFEGVLPMIDAYNKALSEKANDVDYFADAYLKILGPKVEEEDTRYIRANRIINFEGDAGEVAAEFLQKPDGDATQENLLERLERLIFNMSMVANISDENFGQSTGVALKYKLQAMSNLAKTKERKFTSGMNRRYKLIFSNPVNSVKPEDWMKIQYHFTQNYPANVSDEADTAAKLEGIVSTETQLKVLSIVDSVSDEMDKIAREQSGIDNAVLAQMFESDEEPIDEQ